MNIIKELLEAATIHSPKIEESDPLSSKDFKFTSGSGDSSSYVCTGHSIYLMLGDIGLQLTLDFDLHREWVESMYGDGYKCYFGDFRITNHKFIDENGENIDGTNALRMSGGIAAVEQVVEDYLKKKVDQACELIAEQDYQKEPDEDKLRNKRRVQ